MRAPGRPAITYAEFGRAIREIAGGLASLGVEPGDKVAILCGTVPGVADGRLRHRSAPARRSCPSTTRTRPRSASTCSRTRASKVILLEDAAQAAKIAKVRGQLPELEHVVVLDGRGRGRDHAGRPALARRRDGDAVARERTAAVAPEDTATIVYTSGTTGPPKGCVLSHANLLYTADAYIDRLELRDEPPVIFQYLPLAHVLARMVSFVALETGGTLAFWGGDTKKLAADIAEAKPTHVPTVPRLLEKIHTRVRRHGRRPPAARRRRSSRARWRPARRWPRPSARAARSARSTRPAHAVGDQLALRKVRDALGPNDPVLITGAAPIGAEVIEFFYACGVPVLEGYGMTETCAAATLNTLDEVRVGSVGRPLPGTEVSIAEDGEILMRGPHVFKGYHRNQEATDAIMLEGGWLHSGDLGEIERRLRAHHGPQEGPDHHLLAARTSRRRCSRARCARRAGSRRRSRPATAARTSSRSSRSTRTRRRSSPSELGVPRRPGVDGDRREGPRARLEGHRRRQPALRPDRADQALRDPPARPLPGGGRADADAEGQALGRLQEVRAATSTRSTRSE